MGPNQAILKKIIIVDDDEDLLYTLNYWLLHKSFRTIALLDAVNIASIISNFDPDLIIIDVVLKDVDGRKVCRYIKEELVFKKPVLLFSMHNFQAKDINGYSADGFFIKSSDHASMVSYITQYLQQF